MRVLFEVTSERAAAVLVPALQACRRNGVPWGCFFTHRGVEILADPAVVGLLADAEVAVVCEHSWASHMHGRPCPVEQGSQTNNSALVAAAAKVVSL